MKTYSSLSILNVNNYLNFGIPKMRGQVFGILSPNPEYVKAHCNDRNILFHFACCKWYLDNQSL